MNLSTRFPKNRAAEGGDNLFLINVRGGGRRTLAEVMGDDKEPVHSHENALGWIYAGKVTDESHVRRRHEISEQPQAARIDRKMWCKRFY